MKRYETPLIHHDKIADFKAAVFQFPDQNSHNKFDSLPMDSNIDLLLKQCENLNICYTRLKAQLGKETFKGQWYSVEQTLIDQFAQVTGDHQWLHTDPIRAKKESPFRTTIAHGFLTLALIPVLTESVEPKAKHFPEARMIVNCGLNHVQFPFPIKAGKRIRARTKLVSLLPIKRGLVLSNEITIEIENSYKQACLAETVLRLYFQ